MSTVAGRIGKARLEATPGRSLRMSHPELMDKESPRTMKQ